MELDVFAYHCDIHTFLPRFDPLYHLLPFRHLTRAGIDPQLSTNDPRKLRFFQHQRCFIEDRKCLVLYDAIFFDVAKQRDFFRNALVDRLIGTHYDDVWRDPHGLQFLDRVLCRLGFMLSRTLQIRHQRHMYEQAVFFALLQ